MRAKTCPICKIVFSPVKPIQPTCSPKCENKRKEAAAAEKAKKPKESKKKPKPPSVSKRVQYAAELMQLLVRLKASNDNGFCQCVTCGIWRRYNEGMQGGHYISRRFNAAKLMEENISPQCNACNAKHIGNGMLAEYTIYLEDLRGRPFVEYLLSLKKATKKFTRAEVEEIIIETRERIREEQKRICK